MSRVLIAGATGMIGSLVLKECLERQDVDRVTCLLRRSTGVTHPKLSEVMVGDLADLSGAASVFAGVDQAFY